MLLTHAPPRRCCALLLHNHIGEDHLNLAERPTTAPGSCPQVPARTLTVMPVLTAFTPDGHPHSRSPGSFTRGTFLPPRSLTHP
ncbi:MAG: hypothetical protein J2P37_11785, partial [Ktedonobacteraceae bacterium]|nr:hypothetical protein [Ktedonobacteraceae bacterium]